MAYERHWTDRLGGAAGRLVVSTAINGVVILLVPHAWSWTLRGLAGWTAGAGVYLFMAWSVMLRADAAGTKHRCRQEDASRGIVDMLLTAAVFVAFVAVGLALKDSSSGGGPAEAFSVGIPILSAALAWLLVHTLYALHYARMYYAPTDDGDESPIGGIDYHEKDDSPDYRDFLYVSFSIACTYGVTDVEVVRKQIRREIWKHGILSFAFATIVLALTVNVITNLFSAGK